MNVYLRTLHRSTLFLISILYNLTLPPFTTSLNYVPSPEKKEDELITEQYYFSFSFLPLASSPSFLLWCTNSLSFHPTSKFSRKHINLWNLCHHSSLCAARAKRGAMSKQERYNFFLFFFLPPLQVFRRVQRPKGRPNHHHHRRLVAHQGEVSGEPRGWGSKWMTVRMEELCMGVREWLNPWWSCGGE